MCADDLCSMEYRSPFGSKCSLQAFLPRMHRYQLEIYPPRSFINAVLIYATAILSAFIDDLEPCFVDQSDCSLKQQIPKTCFQLGLFLDCVPVLC